MFTVVWVYGGPCRLRSYLVPLQQVWVEANFKETQLLHMQPGQKVEVILDAYPDQPVEGIIDEDVDRCIHNLTKIGRDGMNETDRIVLGIMTDKA